MSDVTCSHLAAIRTVKHAKHRECDECVKIVALCPSSLDPAVNAVAVSNAK